MWQSVLKKGKTSANATLGTVSSTTAQGVLPHYTGHATAYLTPTIANASIRSAKAKAGDADHDERGSDTPEKKGENLPPNDQSHRHNLRGNNRSGGSRKGMVSH
jgi:hypothetical protein